MSVMSQHRLTACCACMQEEQKGTIDSELATVLSSIALACKQIASLVTRAGISNLTGLGGMANSSVSTTLLACVGLPLTLIPSISNLVCSSDLLSLINRCWTGTGA